MFLDIFILVDGELVNRRDRFLPMNVLYIVNHFVWFNFEVRQMNSTFNVAIERADVYMYISDVCANDFIKRVEFSHECVYVRLELPIIFTKMELI